MDNNIIIQVTHRFLYKSETVFDAWLDVKYATLFMFATETGHMVRCEIDPRVGGEFVMTDRRDGVDVEHRGHYLEIKRPHKLVFTFGIPAESPDQDLVTIDINPTDKGCELKLTTEIKPQWIDYVDLARDGWTTILTSLEKALHYAGQ